MRKLNYLRKLSLFSLFYCLAAMPLLAQVTVEGRVIDGSGKAPLPGVGVIVDGTTRGTSTANDGSFRIEASEDEVLKFMYLGYEERTVTVRDFLPDPVMVLNEESTGLDEIIVVGYGTQRKASSVAAITTTRGEDLLKGGNVNSVSEAIQGRLNGVVALNKNAKPGANTAEIYIRGKSSWVDTSPLVLVDGIERDFNDVDFEEIETISVLKDASATAVYGVRGGNGVILLTTKRGTDKKTRVGFSSSVGFKKPTAKVTWPDNVYSMNLYNEALANDQNWGSLIPESTIAAWEHAYATGNYGPYNDVFPQVDWYDAMMRNVGITQHYNVTIDGGNDFMRYFVSLGYHNDGDIYKLKKQDDYDPRSNYTRYNWRSNLDFDLTKSTVLSVNISGSIGYRNEKWAGDGDIYTKILQAPVNSFPVKYSDGYWGDSEAGNWNVLANLYGQGENAVKTSQNWYDLALRQDLSMITPGLSVTAKVSYNSYIRTTSNKLKGKILGQNDYNASYSLIRYNRQYDYSNPTVNADGSITYPLLSELRLPDWNTVEDLPVNSSYDNLNNVSNEQFYEFQINYARTFGDHAVTALALVNRSVRKPKVNDQATMQFPHYREDWVGRITYSYKDRYLSEVNISHTGSEKFAPGYRFGTFPSFSVGWRPTEEAFMKNWENNPFSNLKIRYSYGKVGSDAGATRFGYIQTYNQIGGVVYGDGNGVGTGKRYEEGDVAYPYATWETAKKQNLGLEIGLWNKLNIAVDLFDEKRSGILMAPRDVVFWFGATQSSQNIGRTKNHGIELEINWNDRIGSDWRYSVGFNFAASENMVVYRGDPALFPEYQKDAGKPIGWQKRYIAIGNYYDIHDIYNLAQTNVGTPNRLVPGDLIYIDYNGDGIIDENDMVPSDKLNYPLTTYTLNLGLSWKSLSFSAMLYAPVGQHKINFAQLYFDFPEGNVKAQPNSGDRWTVETANDSGVRRPTVHTREGRTHNDTDNTLRYIDYSYLRLKSAEISYTFPEKWTSRANISNARIFVNGNNLWTWSKIDSRLDPETDSASSYPIVRTYTVGLKFSF